jgi:hypothetical protein
MARAMERTDGVVRSITWTETTTGAPVVSVLPNAEGPARKATDKCSVPQPGIGTSALERSTVVFKCTKIVICNKFWNDVAKDFIDHRGIHASLGLKWTTSG